MGGEVAVGRHGVGVLHRLDDGHVGEEHDRHRHQEAGDEDGDDVGLVDGGVVGLGPVDLAGTVAPVWRKTRDRVEGEDLGLNRASLSGLVFSGADVNDSSLCFIWTTCFKLLSYEQFLLHIVDNTI